jgi:hypothetical protein
MLSAAEQARIYRELSEYYDQRGEAQSRDRCLVLAADALLTAGSKAEADSIRQRLLQLNPHHLLKPFGSMEEAMRSRDVADYVAALRRRHPAEHAASLLSAARQDTSAPSTPPPTLPGRVPPPLQRNDIPLPTHPPEPFRIRQPEESAGIPPRPHPTPMPAPANPARFRAGTENLPPLPVPPPRDNKVSPYRPAARGGGVGSSPSYPVNRGPRVVLAPGAWLCSLLFLVLLLGGLALTAYFLGRAFLPEAWLPERFLSTGK